MKLTDTIRRAAQSLKQAKARTLLTSLAIAVGAFTLTAAMAVGEGARRYGDQLIGDNINPQALFIVADKALFDGGMNQASLREYDENIGMTSAGMSLKLMTQEDIDDLSERDDLEQIIPVYDIAARYMTFGDNDKRFASDLGVYNTTVRATAAQGSLPSQGEQIADDETVLPESFADVLIEAGVVDTAEELIGMTVTLTIAGPTQQIDEDELAAAFMQGGQAAAQELMSVETREIELKVRALAGQSANAMTGETVMLVSTDTARDIAEYTTRGTPQYQRYLGVRALATEGSDPAEVKKDIEEHKGYAAQTAQDLQDLLFTIVNVLQGIVAGFGVLALIASVFGIINTQYISVLERTQQIGLMKALGMRGGHVSRMFQFEAAWIGVLGGVIGAGLAVLVGTLMNPWITEVLKLGERTYLLIFQPLLIIGLIALLSLIAMLAGYFPARKAAKLDPIEALRTE